MRSLALRLRQYLRMASEIFLDLAAAAALLNFFIFSLLLACSSATRSAIYEIPELLTQ